MTISRIETRCLEKGLRMTEQRRIIARVLSDSADHPDVETVYERASLIDKKIGLATVYRTLRLFEEAAILERHDFGDGRSRYEEMPDEQATERVGLAIRQRRATTVRRECKRNEHNVRKREKQQQPNHRAADPLQTSIAVR